MVNFFLEEQNVLAGPLSPHQAASLLNKSTTLTRERERVRVVLLAKDASLVSTLLDCCLCRADWNDVGNMMPYTHDHSVPFA